MLEYPIEEARGLLDKNYKTAKENLKQTEEDLAFLHDQVGVGIVVVGVVVGVGVSVGVSVGWCWC